MQIPLSTFDRKYEMRHFENDRFIPGILPAYEKYEKLHHITITCIDALRFSSSTRFYFLNWIEFFFSFHYYFFFGWFLFFLRCFSYINVCKPRNNKWWQRMNLSVFECAILSMMMMGVGNAIELSGLLARFLFWC